MQRGVSYKLVLLAPDEFMQKVSAGDPKLLLVNIHATDTWPGQCYHQASNSTVKSRLASLKHSEALNCGMHYTGSI